MPSVPVNRRAGHEPPPAGLHRFDLRLIAALAAIYLLWGTSYLALKQAGGSFPPLLLAGLRNLAAGSAMLSLALLLGRGLGSWRALRNAAMVGVLMIALGSGLLARGLHTVSSGSAAVVFAAVPVVVCVILALLGQRISPVQWLGTALGVAGVLMLNAESLAGPAQHGLWMIMGAVAATAAAAVFAERAPMPSDLLICTAVQMAAGGATASLAGWLFGERIVTVSSASLAAFLYLGFLVSVLGFLSYVHVMARAGAVTASSYAYVNPPVALIAGALVLGEQVTPSALLATGVVLAGAITVLAATPRERPRAPALAAFSHTQAP